MYRTLWAAGALAALALAAQPAQALDKLRVGKPTPTAYSFALLEVGIETGIFKKHNLDIETVTLAGGAKVHQAMISGNLDVGLGSGPDMGFIAKGAPEKGVGAMAGPLLNIVITVRADGSVPDKDSLKGKRIGVTTPGSLTYWCAQKFAVSQGWGASGMNIVPLGSPNGMIGALIGKNIDAMTISLESSLKLEQDKRAKILVNYGDTIKTFLTHVIYATNDMMEKRPDQLRAFLAGWYETMKYMKAHKADTIRITRKITHLPENLAEQVYDVQTPMFFTDGHFDKADLAATKQSLVELGQLKTVPPDDALVTEKFLP